MSALPGSAAGAADPYLGENRYNTDDKSGYREEIMQETISRKIYLELPAPTEDDARGDRERILESLMPEYGKVKMPLSVLRTLYPMCRDASW